MAVDLGNLGSSLAMHGQALGTMFGGTAATAATATTAATAATGASAFLGPLGVGLMAADWIYGAWSDSEKYKEMGKELKKSITSADTLMTQAGVDQRDKISDIKDMTSTKAGMVSLDQGNKLENLLASQEKIIKGQKGLKTGGAGQAVEEEKEDLQETLTMQYDNIFSELDFQLDTMGDQYETQVLAAGESMQQMKDDLKYAESHDDWYENLI